MNMMNTRNPRKGGVRGDNDDGGGGVGGGGGGGGGSPHLSG